MSAKKSSSMRWFTVVKYFYLIYHAMRNISADLGAFHLLPSLISMAFNSLSFQSLPSSIFHRPGARSVILPLLTVLFLLPHLGTAKCEMWVKASWQRDTHLSVLTPFSLPFLSLKSAVIGGIGPSIQTIVRRSHDCASHNIRHSTASPLT